MLVFFHLIWLLLSLCLGSANLHESSGSYQQHLRQRNGNSKLQKIDLQSPSKVANQPSAMALRSSNTAAPPGILLSNNSSSYSNSKSATSRTDNYKVPPNYQIINMGSFNCTYPNKLYQSDFDDHGQIIGHIQSTNWRNTGISKTKWSHANAALRNKQSKLPPSPKGYEQYSKSQENEDIWIYEHWFYGMYRGIVLESGALDGMKYSNSYLFERYANWQAIHIEADVINFNHLKTNRKQAINIHAALCEQSQKLHFIDTGGPAARGFYEFMTPTFLKGFHPEVYQEGFSVDSYPVVPCIPLSEIMSRLQISHIDLWILDVEGAEESVLKGVDFSKVNITAISMECDDTDNNKNNRKMKLLQDQGYECELYQQHNCFCKHQRLKISKKSS